MSTPSEEAYHHGDLARACLRAAMRTIEKEGAESLSLRAVARELGVSPRAPYRHFPDKTALLAAVAEEGFGRFATHMQRALAAEKSRDPAARLNALASAYVSFASRHDRLVSLMFGDAFEDREERHPALHRAALASFAVLEAELAPLVAAKSTGRVAAAAWALVHGLAELTRRGQLSHVLPADQRRTFVVFAAGLLLRGAVAECGPPRGPERGPRRRRARHARQESNLRPAA